MSRYRFVQRARDGSEEVYDVGILVDGTLHNPRGYPDDIVRAAVVAADIWCRHPGHERWQDMWTAVRRIATSTVVA